MAKKPKDLGQDKYLVAIVVSPFNPVFFCQCLLVRYPHRNTADLTHPEESTLPTAIQFFSQALTRRPLDWTTAEHIRQQFDREGHPSSFLTSLVAYVIALHNILFLWRRRLVDSRIEYLHATSVETLYPLSPFQRAIYQDIVNSLAQRKRFLD